MQPSASRTSPFHSTALAFALAASALVVGCSGGTDTPAPTASAAPARAANPGAASSAVPGAAKTPAPEAKPAAAAPKVAESPKASESPKISEPAPVAAKEVAPAPTPPTPAKEAPAASSPPDKPAAAPFSTAAASSSPEAQAAREKSELAKKVGDPVSQEPDPNSKAKLTYEFGSDSKNFGKCMQGDVLTHTFQMQSSGEDDLVIKQAKPTCGCTLAQVAVQQADGTMAPYTFGAPIPTGRKIELTATLHTQNKRGHAASRINIFSNDPRGQSQLGLEADVDPFFQVNPQNLNFNQVSARDTANDKVSISTTTGVKVKLAAPAEGLPQGVKFEVNPIEPDADGKSARW
jgi:hypothetical protein